MVFATRNFYGTAQRAGYVWRGHAPTVTVAEGFDTVDISESDEDFVGHGYFLANGLVKDDMFNLLANDLPTDRWSGSSGIGGKAWLERRRGQYA